MGNFLSQWYKVKRWQKFCTETLITVFSNAKKDLSALPPCEFFHVFFSFNLKLICTCEFLKKLKLYFWKIHSCKLIPNWTRNRMITYTYHTLWIHRGNHSVPVLYSRLYPLVATSKYWHNSLHIEWEDMRRMWILEILFKNDVAWTVAWPIVVASDNIDSIFSPGAISCFV